MLKLSLIFFSAFLLMAADEAKKQPVVNQEHWADYLQASADVTDARAAYEAARARQEAAGAVLLADCGPELQPGIDTHGKRGCIAKPAPAAPAK